MFMKQHKGRQRISCCLRCVRKYTKEIALAEQKRADTIHSFKEALEKRNFRFISSPKSAEGS